ncbi:MAG: hypothetical protein Q8P84_05770 [Deltaproteobacteria bacterium]|nr:hypothetical protein [Deltaproteobacteria bacterium]
MTVSKSSSATLSVSQCTLTVTDPNGGATAQTASVPEGASSIDFSVSSLTAGLNNFDVECEDTSLTSNGIKNGFSGSNSGTIASSGNSTIAVSTEFLNMINDGTDDAISADIQSIRCSQPNTSDTECVINFDSVLANSVQDAIECYIAINPSGEAGSDSIVDAMRKDSGRCGLKKSEYFKITQSNGLPMAELYNASDTNIMKASSAWGTADNGNTNITVSLSHKQMKSKIASDQNGKWCAVCLEGANSDAAPNSGSAKLDFRASTVSLDVAAEVKAFGEACTTNGDCSTGLCDPFTYVCFAIPKKEPKPMVVMGNSFSCSLSMNGRVTCWGTNNYGQLSQGVVNSPVYSAAPLPVLNQDGSVLTDVVEIGAGNKGCARLHDGQVKCWGYNGVWGGLGNTANASAQVDCGGPAECGVAYPVSVLDATTGVALTGATALFVGGGQSCVLVNNGGVKCWGQGVQGQTGTGVLLAWPNRTPMATDVVGLGANSGVLKVALGDYHSCAILADKTVQCWGWNVRAVLGRGSGTGYVNDATVWIPTPDYVVTSLGANGTYDSGGGDDTKLSDVVDLWAGGYSVCAKRSSGAVLCWGRNDNYQLADGTVTHRNMPVAITALTDATSIEINELYSCALISGVVKCWGNNLNGNVGVVGVAVQTTPVTISTGTTRVVELGVSIYSTYATCAVLATGEIQCWGQNNLGQLGTGTIIEKESPVYMSLGTKRFGVSY